MKNCIVGMLLTCPIRERQSVSMYTCNIRIVKPGILLTKQPSSRRWPSTGSQKGGNMIGYVILDRVYCHTRPVVIIP